MGLRGSSRSAGLVVTIMAVSVMAGVSTTASAAPTWAGPVTLGQTGRESGPPQIAVTPDGEAVVVWEGGRPNGIQVTSRRPGRGWKRPRTLARSSESAPQIAATRQKAVVVWSDEIRTRGSEASVVFAATRLRGGRWSRPENISAEKKWRFEPEGTEPQVAITRRGEAIAMWTAGDEGHSTTPFIRSAAQPLGRGWTSPVGLRGSIEGQGPQVGVTPGGEAVAIWHAFYNEESGIEVASRPAGGKWSRAKRLASPGAFPDPQLAITPRGEAVAAWEYEEGPGDGLQVATRKPGSRWGVRAFAPQEHERFFAPRIVTEPGGAAAVVWSRSRLAGKEEVMVASHPRGGDWTEPASLFGEEIEADFPAIAVTRSGEWIAVWKSVGPGGRSVIRASSRPRGQPWGAPVHLSSWPAASLPESAAPRIAVAPNGEAVAVWRRYDGTRWVIQAATRGR
jgi:hypothetical protein